MLNRSLTISSRFTQLFNSNTIIKQRCSFPIPNGRCLSSSMMMGFSSRKTLYIGAAIVGSLLGYQEYKRKQIPLDPEEILVSITGAGRIVPKSEVPPIPVSRTAVGPAKLSDMEFNIYQYQSCPFCSKVRAYMDYYGLTYNVIEVDPVLRQQTRFSKYRKVPILLVDQKRPENNPNYVQINDSSLIISILSSYLWFKKDSESLDDLLKYYQNAVNQSNALINKYFLMIGEAWSPKKLKKEENNLAEERYWREWTDNYLVHVLSPNIYRTMGESLETFHHFSKVGQWEENFPAWERYLCIYAGATAMYFVARRLKKKHALKDEVRESLYDSCRLWMKNVGKNRTFMGGNEPNLADLAVYGVLSSIEGCTAFKDLLNNVNIGPWYYAVKNLCQTHAGSKRIMKNA
ncbi:prostaglandin E synthase Su(P) isoform X2 [Brevipalpus obovatus]|uniref:prostaglandin E synthase Su(P) isoform X2 n=1 Tax=Brevipalpus obovatus TaxID=246614 RepID=UPI003D9EA507